MHIKSFLSALLISTLLFSAESQAKDYSNSEITKVVMLGVGAPVPDPSRGGPSVAVVVNGQAYIVDAGVNVVRHAQEASTLFGGKLSALNVNKLNRVFITHLHSDHTMGLPDLMFTPWSFGRDEALQIYGPPEVDHMAHTIQEAWRADISTRLKGGEGANDNGWKVDVHTYSESGIVYQDDNVLVEAIKVPHGSWPNAFAYKFTTPDKVIVISGDNADPMVLKEASQGADLLIHEVYGIEGFEDNPIVKTNIPLYTKYFEDFHSRSDELAAMATITKPKTLVLYHELKWTGKPQQNVDEIHQTYDGKVISSNDQDIF